MNTTEVKKDEKKDRRDAFAPKRKIEYILSLSLIQKFEFNM
jgi:hypothetical protein